jgi:murein DD-endopeptidase MepM/ murein hydrolase activator NlpD
MLSAVAAQTPTVRAAHASSLVRYDMRAASRVAFLTAIFALAIARPREIGGQSRAVLPPDSIRAVLLHPVVRQHFVCLEHPAGQLPNVGDALGVDCLVIDPGTGPAGGWPAFYRGTGAQNADWYGWGQSVLAPFDGRVDSVHVNPEVNVPGILGHSRASVLVFRRADGVRVLYAHVQAIRVSPGDTVRAGQPVARVGNNGPAVMPHTHVAAWHRAEPLQIRFDLRALGRLSRQREPVSESGSPPSAPYRGGAAD